MNFNHLSKIQKELLAVVALFSQSIPQEVIQALAPAPSDRSAQLLRQMAGAGWIIEEPDRCFYLAPRLPPAVFQALRKIITPPRLSEMLDRIRELNTEGPLAPNCLIDLLAKLEQTKEAALLAYDSALKEIENRNFLTAQHLCSRAVLYLKDLLDDPECGRLFVSAAQSLSDLCIRIPEHQDEVLIILKMAIDISRRLGNERSLALLYLHLGRINHIISNPAEAMQAFEVGLDRVGQLGDEDIIARSAEYFGIYYFIQGRLKEALSYFEKAMNHQILQPGQLFNPIIPVYLGNCSVFLGQFFRAIGVVDSQRRRALLASDHYASSFYQACLGIYLLMMGNRREALSHLQAAEKEALDHNTLGSMVWSRRALAYHAYLEGRSQDSYNLLKDTLVQAARAGVRRPFYSWPWILELLFDYHQKGFDSIPELEYAQEMKNALEGLNVHLRGVALRLQAKQVDISGGDPTHLKALLEKSQADLEQVQGPLELSKTRAELALLNLRLGRKNEASNLALLAWEGLSVFGYDFFPAELRSLIKKEHPLIKGGIRQEEILERYIDLMDELLLTDDQDKLYLQLVSATSRFFEAERGALFLIENNRPVLRAAHNLTREETEQKNFRPNLALVREAFKKNKPILKRLPSQAGHSPRDRHGEIALFLPFDVNGQVEGLLYHDSLYSQGVFEILDNPTLKRITQNLGLHIRRIRQYSRTLEEKTLLALRQTTADTESDEWEIVTQNQSMRALLARADLVAQSEAPVLILGETGAGKEFLARRLHNRSSRHMGPFIAINLSAIPDSLMESDLFGHEKGAFTGADYQKPGRLELANKGTLFIDEVGDISRAVQVKLLRALEDKTFFRVGGSRSLSSDFRLIAATNRDLVKDVEVGNFREDLYYRLNVVPLIIPPLRERVNDPILLAQYLLVRYAQRYKKPIPELTMEDKASIKTYPWPGNVRELKNVIERSIILFDGRKLELTLPMVPIKSKNILSDDPAASFADKPVMDELQRRYIDYILKQTGGRISGPRGAARILGMKRSTLYTRMKKLGVLV
jgi:transcriptional regulator with GAF, ATPase, and Fis domain